MRHPLILLASICLVAPGCSPKQEPYATPPFDATLASGYGTDDVAYNPSVLDIEESEPSTWEDSDYGTEAYAEPTEVEQEPATQTTQRVHRVQPRDTLYGLARMYYNDAGKWKIIFEANKNQIPNPDLIRIGMELVIP